MTQEVKILSIIGVLTLILLVSGVFFLSSQQPQSATNQDGQTIYQIDYTKGEKIGSDSARVKLVEFSDFQCPACKSYEPIIQQIRGKQQNNPDFQFIYRHYPLFPVPHKLAKIASEAVEEAGAQGKFWEMHDKIFATQDSWTGLSEEKVTEYFVNLASEIGISGQKVGEAIKNGKHNDKIESDINEAKSLGVNSTPTFFLNGKKMVLGSLNDLEVQVDEALKK